MFTRIILKKAAREHGQKLCTFETLLNNVCVPIERPMINDVDPLVTSEKFQPFFFFWRFFHGHLARYLLDLLFYQLFIIYTLARQEFFGGILTISSDLLAGTLVFHFFSFCKL